VRSYKISEKRDRAARTSPETTSKPYMGASNLSKFPELDPNNLFPFELDDFQKQAIAALNADKSVVVSVPTGSGKTLIGEYAIYRALARGKRVFYTTPLKALSNQKLRDFRDRFGAKNVGLLTGDISVSREASVLVMTTEIFRNMLYGTRIGEMGTSLEDVEAVVLDECHYMNDTTRGTVWEESIIYCPHEIQLVALSATIANSDQLTDWIHRVHGPTELVKSDFRPIPLQFYFCNDKGFFPLLNSKQTKLNPNLNRYKRQKGKRPKTPSIIDVLSHLQERDLLPAIYFIFSRRECDRAVGNASQLKLVNPEEAQEIEQAVNDFFARNPEATARQGQLEPLKRGIAAHHAGVLPAWKGLVEELFQRGLIKVIFATETLAAGINMPARTTVISSLSKRTDRGHRLLKASEFLQMSGRAGRRGMDERGHVVTVQTRFEGVKEAAYLATAQADPLVSQFTPSYGMVLNLLQNHTLEEAKDLVERSFGQYLAAGNIQPQQEAIAAAKEDLEALNQELAGVDLQQLQSYQKLRDRIKEERRLLKTLQSQAQSYANEDLSVAVSFAVRGTLVSIKGANVPTSEPISAILMDKIPGPGQAPYLIILGRDNRWRIITVDDVVNLHAEIPRLQKADALTVPPFPNQKPGTSAQGDGDASEIAYLIPPLEVEVAPEVKAQQERLAKVQDQLENHPARQWGKPGKLLKKYRRAQELEGEIQAMEADLEARLARRWQEFLNLIQILRMFGALSDITPTPLGETAAAIRGDNELWLGMVLSSGKLDGLDPHSLAAACAAFVTEVSRPDSWSNYSLSSEVSEALNSLWGLRKQLIKIQSTYGVDILVLPNKWQDRHLIALVEQWALEVEWQELYENTSLDEGDIIRILRRTLDFLSQIPHVPNISPILVENARRAIQLLDRFPVSESVS